MAASSAAEMKEHRDAEHQHRVAKETAAQRRWEQEQETRKQDRIDDERLRREVADEKARVRKEERDADRDEQRAAAAEDKEVPDQEYRMLLLQMKRVARENRRPHEWEKCTALASGLHLPFRRRCCRADVLLLHDLPFFLLS